MRGAKAPSLTLLNMKNIELLPISSEAKKRLNEFALQYKKHGHIVVEIVSFNDNRLIVRVEQKDLSPGSKHLNKTELENRVKEMFKGELPPEFKLTVSAVDFDRNDIDCIDAKWVGLRLEKYNLKAKNLAVYTGIDKSTLSILLNGNRDLTKWQKVAFYYFFKYYEVSDFKHKDV